MGAKKPSIYAQMLELPVDDPRHQRFRSELWVVGQDFESRYYLSLLTGQNYLEIETFPSMRQALIDYVTSRVSASAGELLAVCRQPECVAHAYLKYQVALCEGWNETAKWSKGERLMILLLEHPNWSDKQFIVALKTTAKQLQRLNCHFHAARADWQRHRAPERGEV